MIFIWLVLVCSDSAIDKCAEAKYIQVIDKVELFGIWPDRNITFKLFVTIVH